MSDLKIPNRPSHDEPQPTGKEGVDFRLLPIDKTFAQTCLAFGLPYIAYVGLGSLLQGYIPIEIVSALKLGIVAALLWYFRKFYRWGPGLNLSQMGIAIGASIVATAIWILAVRFSLALPFWKGHLIASQTTVFSTSYWVLRAIASTLLVPLFEELFLRAYLGEFLFQVPEGAGSFTSRLGQRWDHFPEPLSGPPLSKLSVIGSTLCFTLGHDVASWAAAALYFLFTYWVYAKTRSFRVCIVIHAITNLSIALLVWARPEMHFLW